jgi:hypothetical protein
MSTVNVEQVILQYILAFSIPSCLIIFFVMSHIGLLSDRYVTQYKFKHIGNSVF